MITLVNMTQHTLQEVFDVVATHLLTQNKKAQHEETGECMYRTCDGLRCAVGVLIPDELYDPNMEWTGVVTVTERATKTPMQSRLVVAYEPYLELLTSLQTIHDRSLPSEWPGALSNLAKEYRLTFTPPT